MLTKDNLVAYGADYDKGIKLCLNQEAFYFRMIGKCLDDAKFASLGEHLKAKDWQKSFDDAHALKGVAGNLALTPLFDSIVAIVEPLRQNDESLDYDALYAKIMEEHDKLVALTK